MIRITFKFGGVVEYLEAVHCDTMSGVVMLTGKDGEAVAELQEVDIAKIEDEEAPCPASPSSGS